ncbi:cytochrome P450 [Streptomyces melanosporofaciens]|uniref:Cytochrome P450 n=1 Tax=Streptomyces melanosporofaciens TaxID=67327 RepID=A0A1H4VS26_STRMJ|nr:cytochrome P450 [Streptomyces melanosporofaciens]SEC83847.1 Cytochrome P450 [Streptomyces melanosporofaciens]
MSDPLAGSPAEATASVPAYPMPRATGCPFDPPPALKAMQRKGPLTRVRTLDGSTPWLVTGYADLRALSLDPKISADNTRPGYPQTVPSDGEDALSFIVMDNPEHARLRRMVTAPFTAKKVEKLRPSVQRIVDGLIDDMLAGPTPVDLVEVFALPVPSLVICELLGIPYSDHHFFRENTHVIARRSTSPEDRTSALARLTDYLGDLMGQKLSHPADDLLSGLVPRVKAGELTRQDAAQMGVLLLLAGHETSANMIALGTLALMEHSEQLALLRESDDPTFIAAAVEELLRYLTVVQDRPRVAREDIEIGGQLVRAGEGLFMSYDMANRDPEKFPDPDRLDLRRDARRHVAFGHGAHQCLGQTLARIELQVVFGTLHRRIPTLEVAAQLKKLPFKHDALIYGVHELPVTW